MRYRGSESYFGKIDIYNSLIEKYETIYQYVDGKSSYEARLIIKLWRPGVANNEYIIIETINLINHSLIYDSKKDYTVLYNDVIIDEDENLLTIRLLGEYDDAENNMMRIVCHDFEYRYVLSDRELAEW
ncbi:hypothetical protein [Rubricoccus marinus]|uniref:hypothetical protein n=1 Tax=Rubricoccus marinus TaxID=716817 RepID=UPI001179D13C|nr:hypothetical protein [Rubricoccus marinus]